MTDLRVPGDRDPMGVRRGPPFRFRFGGDEIRAHGGETIGGALLAAGRRVLRRTRVEERPRGLFCGIGSCFDCLVTVDGRGPVRACLAPAAPGADVAPHVPAAVGAQESGSGARMHPPGPDGGRGGGDAPGDAEVVVDLAIVGAGPGGLEAAVRAAGAGIEVAVVDAAPRPGGQYHRQVAVGLEADAPGALHHGWRAATQRMATVAASPLIHHLADTQVWAVEVDDQGVTLQTVGPHARTVRARELLLATGAVERTLPFPGWDLPGVLTVGAAQALLKSQGIRAGERVLVAGAGPLLLPVAAALVRTGTQVVAVCDGTGPDTWRRGGLGLLAPAKAAEAAGYLGVLARARVPYRPRTAVIRAEGDQQVERAVIARIDADWHVVPGTEESVDVDAVCLSHGFAPAIELAVALRCQLTHDTVPAVVVDQLQRTTVDRVSAVGEVTGVAGADAAVTEGAVAGLAAARRLGGTIDARELRRLARRRDRGLAFAAALRRATAPADGWVGWLDDDTLVCRCEEVPYARVRAAIANGVGDPRSIKLTTRCGMGYCQGRMCAPIVGDLLHHATGTVPPEPGALSLRPIATPVRLGSL